MNEASNAPPEHRISASCSLLGWFPFIPFASLLSCLLHSLYMFRLVSFIHNHSCHTVPHCHPLMNPNSILLFPKHWPHLQLSLGHLQTFPHLTHPILDSSSSPVSCHWPWSALSTLVNVASTPSHPRHLLHWHSSHPVDYRVLWFNSLQCLPL